MICIACILIILAVMPIGYYFVGPISLVIGSIMILYIGYRKTCSDNTCEEEKR